MSTKPPQCRAFTLDGVRCRRASTHLYCVWRGAPVYRSKLNVALCSVHRRGSEVTLMVSGDTQRWAIDHNDSRSS